MAPKKLKNKKKKEKEHKTHKTLSKVKKKKRHSKKKRKHSKKHRHAKDDMLDLSKKLYPISYYLSDRKEMLNQAFLSLDWKQTKRMLAASLKNMPIAKVKELALRELLGMSNERITCVLNGQQLESSSDSDVAIDTATGSTSTGFKRTKDTKKNQDIQDDGRKRWPSGKEGKINAENILQGSDTSSDMDTLEIGITPKEIGDLLEDAPPSKEKGSGEDDKKGKSMLEILELEMRARAIRALLKQQDDGTPIVKSPARESKKKYHDLSGSEVLHSSNQPMQNLDEKSLSPRKDKSLSSVSNISGECSTKITTENESDSIHNDHTSLPCQVKVTECIDNDTKCEEISEMPCSKEYSENNLSTKEVSLIPENHNENSWTARWFHSKDVQKVVSTSRMCAKIRNRMKLAQKSRPSFRHDMSQLEIVGSVKEYKTLGKNGHSDENTS